MGFGSYPLPRPPVFVEDFAHAPLPPPETIDAAWLEKNIFMLRPEEVGALWDEADLVIAWARAGPGTRQNIDEFTDTTARGLEKIGHAARGKAIIVLNPAELRIDTYRASGAARRRVRWRGRDRRR